MSKKSGSCFFILRAKASWEWRLEARLRKIDVLSMYTTYSRNIKFSEHQIWQTGYNVMLIKLKFELECDYPFSISLLSFNQEAQKST